MSQLLIDPEHKQHKHITASHPAIVRWPNCITEQSNEKLHYLIESSISTVVPPLGRCCCCVCWLSWSLEWPALELTKDNVREQEPVQGPPADWELRAHSCWLLSSLSRPRHIVTLHTVTSPPGSNRHFSVQPRLRSRLRARSCTRVTGDGSSLLHATWGPALDTQYTIEHNQPDYQD